MSQTALVAAATCQSQCGCPKAYGPFDSKWSNLINAHHAVLKKMFPMFTEGINQVRRRRIFSLTSSPCQCVLGPEMFPQRQSARLSETLHKIQCICSICFLSRVAYIPCVYVDGKNVLTFVPLVELRMCIKWGRVVNHPISGSYMLCFNINTCSSFFLQQKVSTLLLQFPQNPFL